MNDLANTIAVLDFDPKAIAREVFDAGLHPALAGRVGFATFWDGASEVALEGKTVAVLTVDEARAAFAYMLRHLNAHELERVAAREQRAADAQAVLFFNSVRDRVHDLPNDLHLVPHLAVITECRECAEVGADLPASLKDALSELFGKLAGSLDVTKIRTVNAPTAEG